MKTNKLIVILFLQFVFVNITKAQSEEWRFIKETKGVKVFYRSDPNSNINQVKITTIFDADIATIITALTDVQAFPKWVYGINESKMVKKISNSEIIYHNKIGFPWPMSNRDIVIHSLISQDEQSKVVTSVSHAVLKELPIDKDFIRIKKFNSTWTFEPNTSGVAATYIFSSDPGGNIPAWAVNMALDQGPVQTIRNFKKLLLLPEYHTNHAVAYKF